MNCDTAYVKGINVQRVVDGFESFSQFSRTTAEQDKNQQCDSIFLIAFLIFNVLNMAINCAKFAHCHFVFFTTNY